MKRSLLVFGLLVGGLVFGLALAVGLLLLLAGSAEREPGSFHFGLGDRVAVVFLEGLILDSRPLIEELQRHRDNDAVEAIVLRIDSPGGAVAPSQEIYHELLRLREEGEKPLVVSMGSVAASGGYYAASAADLVLANRGSVTGSIGVVMEWTNYSDLLEWAKLENETIVSAPFKAAGNPARDMSDEERVYLQAIVDQLHDQFVSDVAVGRAARLDEAAVAKLADGRIYTGEEAVELGLVDEIGDLEDAIDRAADLAGIEGEPTVVYPRRREPGLLDLLGTTLLGRIEAGGLSPLGRCRFYYLW